YRYRYRQSTKMSLKISAHQIWAKIQYCASLTDTDTHRHTHTHTQTHTHTHYKQTYAQPKRLGEDAQPNLACVVSPNVPSVSRLTHFHMGTLGGNGDSCKWPFPLACIEASHTTPPTPHFSLL